MLSDFDEFVVARGPALLRFGYVLSGNSHLAEDLVQEVLARVHLQWRRVTVMQAPEAYVRTAMVRQYVSWRRRRASTERVVAEVPDWVNPTDPHAALVDRDEVWALLARLPRAQRAVLVLRFYQDLNDEEIANVLGCAASTVRAHGSRALARLRTVLAGTPSVEADRG